MHDCTAFLGSTGLSEARKVRRGGDLHRAGLRCNGGPWTRNPLNHTLYVAGTDYSSHTTHGIDTGGLSAVHGSPCW